MSRPERMHRDAQLAEGRRLFGDPAEGLRQFVESAPSATPPGPAPEEVSVMRQGASAEPVPYEIGAVQAAVAEQLRAQTVGGADWAWWRMCQRILTVVDQLSEVKEDDEQVMAALGDIFSLLHQRVNDVGPTTS